jgi:hypothetical protein
MVRRPSISSTCALGWEDSASRLLGSSYGHQAAHQGRGPPHGGELREAAGTAVKADPFLKLAANLTFRGDA